MATRRPPPQQIIPSSQSPNDFTDDEPSIDNEGVRENSIYDDDVRVVPIKHSCWLPHFWRWWNGGIILKRPLHWRRPWMSTHDEATDQKSSEKSLEMHQITRYSHTPLPPRLMKHQPPTHPPLRAGYAFGLGNPTNSRMRMTTTVVVTSTPTVLESNGASNNKDDDAVKMVGINLLSRCKTNTTSPPLLLFNTSDPQTTLSHS